MFFVLILTTFFTLSLNYLPPGPPAANFTTTSKPITTTYPPTTSTARPNITTTTAPPMERVSCKNHLSLKEHRPENGDLVCEMDYGGSLSELLVRDTIVNSSEKPDSHIYYRKFLPGSRVNKVQVLNFGKVEGFVEEVRIEKTGWFSKISVDVEVPFEEEVKLFVEIYGYK